MWNVDGCDRRRQQDKPKKQEGKLKTKNKNKNEKHIVHLLFTLLPKYSHKHTHIKQNWSSKKKREDEEATNIIGKREAEGKGARDTRRGPGGEREGYRFLGKDVKDLVDGSYA